MERVTLGGSASMQAVTRVNAEQASKTLLQEPTRLRNGEGRRYLEETQLERAKNPDNPAGVVAMACMHMEIRCNTGSLMWWKA